STWVYAVQVSATAQTSPPQITLTWPADPYGATSYTVYRKTKESTSWGTGASLSGSATSYVDSNVAVGGSYEYQIVKQGSLGYRGYGYIHVGVNAPLVDDRGKVILVVDNTHAASLASELNRLQQDLAGDGWTVIRRDVSRADTPANIRNAIRAEYNADPANVKAVFLFGRIPVLRSGNLNVDGHEARPMPADVFYGDMDGNWTDGNGDGICDQNTIPSDIDLMVGRVDFANMPGNGLGFPSEVELLRRYLNKDHNFRHGILTAPRRGLVGNRFGDFSGQAFAASGYRSFSAFFGANNTFTANSDDGAPAADRWSSMLAGNSYLWAYGCGGGSTVSMSGLGTHGAYNDVWSIDLVGQDAKAIFYMMFGSWLGDWDQPDNIMRSGLATPNYGLTCSWSGRPHHYYHHMALGETVGYGIRLSQNNSGLYQNQVNSQLRGIHIALMGDPTLRLHVVLPPQGLAAIQGASGVSLNWLASPDSNIVGYHVYRATSTAGPFTRLTGSPVSGTTFLDTSVLSGNHTYMVRAVKLETAASGSYHNASQGIFQVIGGGPAPTLPTVAVTASDATAAEPGTDTGAFTISRTGSTTLPLTVNYTLGGTASSSDYQAPGTSVTIPAGASSATLIVTPLDDTAVEGSETVLLTLASSAAYNIGSPDSATVAINDNDSTPPLGAPLVTVVASDATATIGTSDNAEFTFARTGDTTSALTVNYT
ncbi:MAG TPA: C25 family cysteine peptidase, partial [Methylomirabilota bacterium]|nr:C25 family cysteine peptidase [Methylomirabilota bacterium]